jgi:hypothetical protein
MNTTTIARTDLPKGLDDTAHLYRNIYECPCGNSWEDVWDCGCDDECGECGKDISPSDSFDLDGCECPECERRRTIREPIELQSVAAVDEFMDFARAFLDHWTSDEEIDGIEKEEADARAAEFDSVRTFVLAAVEAFTVERAAEVQRQLGMIDKALAGARDMLDTVAECLPNGEPEQREFIGSVEAAKEDCIEAGHFVARIRERHPQVLPMPVSVGQTKPVRDFVAMKIESTPGTYVPPGPLDLIPEPYSARQGRYLTARRVVDSEAALRVYASCEWDELSDDGKEWIATIVEETQRTVQPPKIVVMVGDGMVYRIVSTVPVEALVTDSDIDCADPEDLFYLDRENDERATVQEFEVLVDDPEVHRIAEAHREIHDNQMAAVPAEEEGN